MMSLSDSLVLYTVESRWVNDAFPSRAIPYDRVIAVENGDELLVAQKHPAADPKADFSDAPIDSHVIEMSEEMRQRISSYFLRYFVEGPEDRYDLQSCHTFALFLRYNTFPDEGLMKTILADKIVNGEPATSLVAGQHAVFGTIRPGQNQHMPYHSVIGLGDTENRCLQVIEQGGYLALEPFNDTTRACEVTYHLPGGEFFVEPLPTLLPTLPGPADQAPAARQPGLSLQS